MEELEWHIQSCVLLCFGAFRDFGHLSALVSLPQLYGIHFVLAVRALDCHRHEVGREVFS